MDIEDIINYLRGTARNLASLASHDPEGETCIESLELAEVATKLDEIADEITELPPTRNDTKTAGPPLAFSKQGNGGEVDWFCVGCRRPLWACDDDTCRGHECRASGPIGGTTFCDGSCRSQTTSTCLERRKLDRAIELLGEAAVQTTARSDLELTSPLSAAVRDQLDKLAGEVRQQLDAGHMPNGNDLDRLARWAQQAARYGVADQAWREWAAKILAAYPWVDEFKPEDSDEKYRDGVRYVLLCIEYNSGGGIAVATEMQDIKAKWGFS